ncbi:hypothetical protein [Saccharothrix variisporea]|uniref:hypothetical protein n=1 Tax=Saccharothrix variisporea TaxID=543527 RepID=UPI0011C4735D|nr:hypothetical protein [Saccharothrix variisporea]
MPGVEGDAGDHPRPGARDAADRDRHRRGAELPRDGRAAERGQPRGKKVGGRVCELLTYIAKTGPAAGYSLILATQKPDAQVIPDGLRGQFGTRFALKVMTYQAPETILGAGTCKAGMDASKLLTSHKGAGLLLGADGETELSAGDAVAVRTYLLHIAAIRTACERGRALREQAGALTGDAAGQHNLATLDPTVAGRLGDDVTTTATGPEPVEAELVHELPEVLALLADVIGDDEHGLVPGQNSPGASAGRSKHSGRRCAPLACPRWASGRCRATTTRSASPTWTRSGPRSTATKAGTGRHAGVDPRTAVPTSAPPRDGADLHEQAAFRPGGHLRPPPDQAAQARWGPCSNHLGTSPRSAHQGRKPMPTMTTSRHFRPGRWLMLGAAACFAAYLVGLISATPASPAPTPPSAVCAN